MHAEPPEGFFIHGRKDNGGMNLTAFEFRKLGKCQFGGIVGSGKDDLLEVMEEKDISLEIRNI